MASSSPMVAHLKMEYLFHTSLWFDSWLSEKQPNSDNNKKKNFKSKNQWTHGVLICKTLAEYNIGMVFVVLIPHPHGPL